MQGLRSGSSTQESRLLQPSKQASPICPLGKKLSQEEFLLCLVPAQTHTSSSPSPSPAGLEFVETAPAHRYYYQERLGGPGNSMLAPRMIQLYLSPLRIRALLEGMI